MLNLFNKFSGLKGLSGISDEMKTIVEEARRGNKQAQIAIDVFCYRVRKYISAYVGVLNGADALVFSAGIGVNAPSIRAKCAEGLQFLGIKLDKKKNEEAVGREALISSRSSKVKVYVIPDNEELTMAFRTRDVLLEAKAPPKVEEVEI